MGGPCAVDGTDSHSILVQQGDELCLERITSVKRAGSKEEGDDNKEEGGISKRMEPEITLSGNGESPEPKKVELRTTPSVDNELKPDFLQRGDGTTAIQEDKMNKNRSDDCGKKEIMNDMKNDCESTDDCVEGGGA